VGADNINIVGIANIFRGNKNMTLEENVKKQGEEHLFQEKTELGTVMENLDSDSVDESTGMSSIDFNTRLKEVEIGNIIIIDELMRLGILPDKIGLTRQKKRLAVSIEGKGREEKVRIVAGEREMRSGGGFGEKLKNFFTPQR